MVLLHALLLLWVLLHTPYAQYVISRVVAPAGSAMTVFDWDNRGVLSEKGRISFIGMVLLVLLLCFIQMFFVFVGMLFEAPAGQKLLYILLGMALCVLLGLLVIIIAFKRLAWLPAAAIKFAIISIYKNQSAKCLWHGLFLKNRLITAC